MALESNARPPSMLYLNTELTKLTRHNSDLHVKCRTFFYHFFEVIRVCVFLKVCMFPVVFMC